MMIGVGMVVVFGVVGIILLAGLGIILVAAVWALRRKDKDDTR